MTTPLLQHFGQVIHHDDPAENRPVASSGHCTLVATGHGDPKMLSANVLQAIRTATMVLVDDLVNDSVVALAMSSARVVHVGKRSSGLTKPQALVEKLILIAVHEGQQVVHLMYDNPLARGDHRAELTHLQAAGISAVCLDSAGRAQHGFLSVNTPQNPNHFQH